MNAPAGTALQRLTFALGALCLLAGAWLCLQQPSRAWAWLLGMLLVPLAWLVQRRRNAVHAASREFLWSLAMAASLLALSLVAAILSKSGWLDPASGLPQRSLGVLMGAIIMVFANAIPKQAASARRLAMLRLAGWSMLLGGLAYALAWLLAPLALALPFATGCLLLASLHAVARIARDCWFKRPASPPPG